MTDLPAPAAALSPDVPEHRAFLHRVFVEYNPFYLLSALCMLAGLFALNNSLDWSPLPKTNLLWMIFTLQVYELLLIGLGIFLLRKGLVRDAMMLLVLEVFFLADAGFLNAEMFKFDVTKGLIVNIVLLALAMGKIALIFVGARLPPRSGLFAFILVEIVALFGVPGFFAHVASLSSVKELSPLAVYAGWWIVGLLPVLYVMLTGGRHSIAHPAVAVRGLARVLLIVPFVSILAHLCTDNWVYDVRFHLANVAPLILGLSLAAGHYETRSGSVVARARTQLLLPLLAIALSAFPPYSLVFPVVGEFYLSPFRLVMFVAGMIYLDGFFYFREALFIFAAIGAFLGSTMGVSLPATGATAGQGVKWSFGQMWRLVPRSATHWGITSVAMAFVLLAVGALISLLKRPRQNA